MQFCYKTIALVLYSRVQILHRDGKTMIWNFKIQLISLIHSGKWTAKVVKGCSPDNCVQGQNLILKKPPSSPITVSSFPEAADTLATFLLTFSQHSTSFLLLQGLWKQNVARVAMGKFCNKLSRTMMQQQQNWLCIQSCFSYSTDVYPYREHLTSSVTRRQNLKTDLTDY